ncbi:unnamed protein product [Lampetra planeri]
MLLGPRRGDCGRAAQTADRASAASPAPNTADRPNDERQVSAAGGPVANRLVSRWPSIDRVACGLRRRVAGRTVIDRTEVVRLGSLASPTGCDASSGAGSVPALCACVPR